MKTIFSRCIAGFVRSMKGETMKPMAARVDDPELDARIKAKQEKNKIGEVWRSTFEEVWQGIYSDNGIMYVSAESLSFSFGALVALLMIKLETAARVGMLTLKDKEEFVSRIRWFADELEKRFKESPNAKPSNES